MRIEESRGLLRSVAVQQRTLLYLLSEGSRVNRLWLGWVLSSSILGLCADISLISLMLCR